MKPQRIRLFSLCIIFLTTYIATAEASIPPYQRPETMNDTYPLLFGTQETGSDNLAAFPKWINVMARAAGENTTICSRPSAASPCKAEEWKQYLDGIRGRPLKEQLVLVNNYVNSQAYRRDSATWQVSDYWQTPKEFFEMGGDCEDFAIAKYMSLKRLGVPQNAMRLVVLNDKQRRTVHAVLSVYADGETYILDNQIKKVVPLRIVGYYQPIYSINEERWWRHKA